MAHVRFDERGVETEWETLLGHRRPGRPGYVYAALPPLRHTSTLPISYMCSVRIAPD
jgi:hypothetical protein